MSEQPETHLPKRRVRILPVHIIGVLALVTLAFGLGQMLLNTGVHRPATGQEAWLLDTLRQLGEAMQAFAGENDGRFPTGGSSVEVFNQLIAGGHLKDHRLAMEEGIDHGSLLGVVSESGKDVRASPEKTRLFERVVVWDATANATTSSPAGLPLLYSTGFEVDYTPGAAPVPRPGTAPRIVYVYTVDGQTRLYRLENRDNWEHPFIPEGADADLRQLTPGGGAGARQPNGTRG